MPIRGRRTAATLLALAALFLGAVLYAWHIGYPWGPVYTAVPASAAPKPAARGTVAVFFSGDMGFNTGMGPRIVAHVAAEGIPVLGVNSLTAFAQRRSPQQAGQLVRDTVGRALAMPGARRLLLIGQSFGADAIVAGAQGLPEALRRRIALVALIVPADTLSYRATPGGIASFGDDGPSLPLARGLDWAPALCIQGREEAHSLCPAWRQPNVRRIALPGGHFLREDAALVAATILHAAGARADRSVLHYQ